MLHVHLEQAQLAQPIEAAENGETVYIENVTGELFQLMHVSQTRRQPVYGSGSSGIVWMSDDFDTPLDDFVDF